MLDRRRSLGEATFFILSGLKGRLSMKMGATYNLIG
mgnify:FL=1